MSKSNNARSNRGGRITKTNEGTGSVAPSGDAVIEQPAEVAAEDASTDGSAEEAKPEESAPEQAPEPEVTQPEQAVETEAQVAATDPFAALPVVKIEDYEFRDLSGAESVSDPRKYEGVHRAAVAAKAHMKAGWKHSAAMITVGTHQRDFKPGSVYGTIDQIVRSYGRAGVPAYVLVAKVRQAQIGNKRSHYCTALPPVGWAEGWVDSYVSKKHGKVMEKKAPMLTEEVAAEIQAGDAEAEQKARNAA